MFLLEGMHLSDNEFGEANPNRKVPAIQDGDFTLFEWYYVIFLLLVFYLDSMCHISVFLIFHLVEDRFSFINSQTCSLSFALQNIKNISIGFFDSA